MRAKKIFHFLTTKYEKIAKLEHLVCPKVGGGGAQTHLCPPPTFESAGAQAPAAPPPSPTPLNILYVSNKKAIEQRTLRVNFSLSCWFYWTPRTSDYLGGGGEQCHTGGGKVFTAILRDFLGKGE